MRVTGIPAGLPVAPVEVTVTVPLWGPTERAARPAGLIDTLIELGTVPLGVAESHADAAPVSVVNEIPEVPVAFTDCAVGVLAPIV